MIFLLHSLCMLVIISLIAWIKISPCVVLLLLSQAFISCHWLAFQASLFYSQLLLSYPLDLQWWCFDLNLFPYLMVPFCVVFCFKISSLSLCFSDNIYLLRSFTVKSICRKMAYILRVMFSFWTLFFNSLVHIQLLLSLLLFLSHVYIITIVFSFFPHLAHSWVT